jgi:hypothetical protein
MRLFGADPESRTSACVWIPGSRQRVRAKRGPMTGSDARPGMTANYITILSRIAASSASSQMPIRMPFFT